MKSKVGLYRITPGVDPAVAGLLEPIASVVFGLRKLNVHWGETVVVIGGGTMGLLNALMAREYGARVLVSELLPKKLETVRSCGIEVIDAGAADPVQEVMRLTGGRGADAVILAVGAQSATDQSFEMLKPKRGRVLLFAAAYPSPRINLDVNTIHYRKIDIMGTFGADHRDFQTAADAINRGKIDFTPVIESRYSFENMEDAMKAACVPGAYRVCVEMK